MTSASEQPSTVKAEPKRQAPQAALCPIVAARTPVEPHAAAIARGPSVARWALASVGVACVGLAAVGVAVPGMPTTVFLLAAVWCFARSCTWLEDRLIRNRFFAPFLPFLVPGVAMPLRAKVISLTMMWAAIGVSGAVFVLNDIGGGWPAIGTVGLGLIGTWFITRR